MQWCPFSLNVEAADVGGTQYWSGGYFYHNETQTRLAQESKEAKQAELKDQKIVTEAMAAKRFYRADEYHRQYVEKRRVLISLINGLLLRAAMTPLDAMANKLTMYAFADKRNHVCLSWKSNTMFVFGFVAKF